MYLRHSKGLGFLSLCPELFLCLSSSGEGKLKNHIPSFRWDGKLKQYCAPRPPFPIHTEAHCSRQLNARSIRLEVWAQGKYRKYRLISYQEPASYGREVSIKLKKPGEETVFVRAPVQTLFFRSPAPTLLARGRTSINTCWMTKIITSSLIPYPEVRGNCVYSGELKVVSSVDICQVLCWMLYIRCLVQSHDQMKHLYIYGWENWSLGMLDTVPSRISPNCGSLDMNPSSLICWRLQFSPGSCAARFLDAPL